VNHQDVAAYVADLVVAESPGTKVIVWADGTVTRDCTVANPVLQPGSRNWPVAFFVAGIDRPISSDIALRIERAFQSQLRPAS
jgi:hypothetical protein